jgi:hypothetical protein
MTSLMNMRVFKRLFLALAAGALLFQTTCTMSDLLSAYGLSSLLGALTSTST